MEVFRGNGFVGFKLVLEMVMQMIRRCYERRMLMRCHYCAGGFAKKLLTPREG